MDAIQRIDRFDWDDMGMSQMADGDYMLAEAVLQTLAGKDAEIARLKTALEPFANIAYFSNIVDGFVITLDDIDQQAALQRAFANARAALTQPTEQPK